MDNYILDGKTPVRCDDLMTWANWFEKANRHVANDKLPNDVRVSTIFLGLDHRFGDEGDEPILFETMIFGGQHDQFQDRYCTWAEAEAGPARAMGLVKATQP